jgi:hypothetical protein
MKFQNFILALNISLLITNINGQEINLETEYKFETLTKDSYLGNVTYNEEEKSTVMEYVEKDMFKTTFKRYYFDEGLNFLREENETFNNIAELLKELKNDVKGAFSWFNYKGESYTSEYIKINQGMGGKIVAYKQKVTHNFSWFLGFYTKKYSKPEVIKIKSETDDKLYLYDYFFNEESGDAYMLVGLKAPKKSKDKYLHTRKFQIVKLSNDLVPEYLEEITFDYNMAISYKNVVYNKNAELAENSDVMNIKNGKLYLVFSPIKTMMGKKFSSPNPGNNLIVVLDENGKIESKIDYTATTSGWLIKGLCQADNGDLFFYGPAKEDAYVNNVMPTNSPLTLRTEVKDIKWKNFQIMKISQNKFDWINSTDLKAFKTKAVSPPSQKQMPVYQGKNFVSVGTFVSPAGELFIAGQNFTTKKVPDPNSRTEGATIKVLDDYKDLIMFHFDNSGSLKSQYGIRRDKMNKYSKRYRTPQYLNLSGDAKSLFWTYGEIKGMRGLELMPSNGSGNASVTISKSKLLFYPAVSKIDLESGTLTDFIPLGADSEGKQKYFTNPLFPQLLSPDGSKLTFFGEDKKGSLVWLAQMNLN